MMRARAGYIGPGDLSYGPLDGSADLIRPFSGGRPSVGIGNEPLLAARVPRSTRPSDARDFWFSKNRLVRIG